jgi:hypothetical protein
MEHRIPLAPPAAELMRGLYTVSDNDFVFLGMQAGKPLGHTAFSTLLKRLRDKRRALMTAWAKFCASPPAKAGCDVVTPWGTR